MTNRIKDDFLTCAVCYDLYDDPRTLACGHTFCLSCLENFAETNGGAIRAKSLPCPFCRQLTEAPDPHAPVKEWAGQVKSTTIIQELSDMVAIRENSIERGNDTSNEKLTQILCEDHKKYITNFCKDCQTTLCPTCIPEIHRHCDTVVPVEDILPTIHAELSETKDKLTRLTHKIKDRIESQRSKRVDLMKRKDVKRQEISNMCQRAIDAVREREMRLLQDLETEAEEEASRIQLGVRLSERTAMLQEQQSELVEKTLMYGSDVEKYHMFKVCSNLYFEDEGSVGNNHVCQFVLRHRLWNLDNTLDSVLGRLDVHYDAAADPGQDLDEDGVIVIRTDEDEEDPFPVDVAIVSFLDFNALVVSDNANCSVKSFFIENNVRSHSTLGFSSPPWALSKLMTNQVLVALPDSNHIARVKVTPTLTMLSRITTRKQYRSVTALGPSTFAAGSSSLEDPCVDILDLNGHLIRSFTTHFPLKNPSYLSVLSNGKIVVSDFGLGTITCVTTQGRMDFTYRRDLEGPSGVAVTKSGGMVVVDRQKGSLVQYDAYDKYSVQRPSFTSLTDTYEKTPWGVCIDTFGRIFITQGEEIRVMNSSVCLAGQNITIASVYMNS